MSLIHPILAAGHAQISPWFVAFRPYPREYDIIFFCLGCGFIYPDRFLDWLSEHTGRTFGIVALVVLELAIAGTGIAMEISLQQAGYTFLWWGPLGFLLVPIVARVATRFFKKLFGFED